MKYLFLLTILLTSLVNAENKKEKPKQFIIKSTIAEGSKIITAPAVVTQLNNEAIIRIVTEKHLPENWEIDAENLLPKPSFDDPTDFGVTKKVVVKEFEKDGQKLTLLHGELILRSEEKTPELTEEKPESSTKDYLFFQTEKKVRFAFDMTSRKKVSFKFKEGEKTYKTEMELSEVISEKPEK